MKLISVCIFHHTFQIIPPHDSGISSHISAQSTPWSTSWDTSILNNNPNVIDPLVLGTMDAYFSDLKEYCFRYIVADDQNQPCKHAVVRVSSDTSTSSMDL